MVEVVDERIEKFERALLAVSDKRFFRSSEYPDFVIVFMDVVTTKVKKVFISSEVKKSDKRAFLSDAIINVNLLKKSLENLPFISSTTEVDEKRGGALIVGDCIVSCFGSHPDKNFHENISANILSKMFSSDDFEPCKRYLQRNNNRWLFSYN